MRKPVLALIAVVALAAFAGWFFFLRDTSQGTKPKPAVTSEGKTTDRPKAPEDRGGDRDGGLQAVLVDDDPKGELQLEGLVLDGDEKPVGGATVSVSSNPP